MSATATESTPEPEAPIAFTSADVLRGLLGFGTGAVVGGGLAAFLFSSAPDVVLVIGSSAALLTGVSAAPGWRLAAPAALRHNDAAS